MMVGYTVWTCHPSAESENFGDYDPVKPREVRITNRSGNFITASVVGCEKTVVYCNTMQIFHTEVEALDEWKKLVQLKMQLLECEIQTWKNMLDEVMQNGYKGQAVRLISRQRESRKMDL